MLTNPWQISGTYFEVCNCRAISPCRRQNGLDLYNASTNGFCQFALSWRIVDGNFDGTDLSDRSVVMAGSYRDDEPKKPWLVILYIDERSSCDQFSAISDIFLGRAGGTSFRNFALRFGYTHAIRRAAIHLDHRPGRWSMSASTWLEARASRIVSSGCAVTSGIPGHDQTGNELIADTFRVKDPPLDIQLSGRCGYESRFDYSSEAAKRTSQPMIPKKTAADEVNVSKENEH